MFNLFAHTGISPQYFHVLAQGQKRATDGAMRGMPRGGEISGALTECERSADRDYRRFR